MDIWRLGRGLQAVRSCSAWRSGAAAPQALFSPVIGHEVQGEGGEVMAELEAAWPELRQGIVIDALTVPDWRIWRVGDSCTGT